MVRNPSSSCIVAQYAGRLHREFEGKQDVQIYDYIDIHVPVCETMYRKRLKGYASIGYVIRNNELFDSFFPTIDVIYNANNFESPFLSDISNPKLSIVISCPKVRIRQQSPITKQLIHLAASTSLAIIPPRIISSDSRTPKSPQTYWGYFRKNDTF